jgi:hypothetical protein
MTQVSYFNRGPATFSTASIVAILAAVGSFFTGWFLGLLLALVAIGFGAIGLLAAAAPHRRGGILSVLSIAGGLLGIVLAVVKLVLAIVS